MSWKVTEQPAFEPLSLQDAKDYLRVQHSADDDVITGIIEAARSYCEEELDLAIIEQEITLKLDGFPAGRTIRLPRANLLSVTSVSYQDSDGASQTFTDYTADDFQTPARIVNNTSDWPETEDVANAVTIVYRAGFVEYNTAEATTGLPGAVSQAMRMLVSHYYDNRSAVVIGSPSEEVAMAVTALLHKYRRLGL